ncbi:MAG: hypothetical protein U9Q79_01185, partial [Candidatus Hydrogenedentes bacterium]|nr:hypothetical protein [Candidatus Hydrogenedentota bacterium]
WLNVSLAGTLGIFETPQDERFGSPVDDENEAQRFQKPWDSPVSSRILRDSLGTVRVFEIFEAEYEVRKTGDCTKRATKERDGAVPGFSLLTVCGQGYPTADRPRPHFHDLRGTLTAHVSLYRKGFTFFAVGWASGVKNRKKLPMPTENTIFNDSRG